MNLRTLTARILNRDGDAPAGTTHMVSHIPPEFLTPPNGVGLWEIWTLSGYYDGTHDETTSGLQGFDAPASQTKRDVAAFAAEALGCPVRLVLSHTELKLDAGDEWVTEPVYYVIPL